MYLQDGKQSAINYKSAVWPDILFAAAPASMAAVDILVATVTLVFGLRPFLIFGGFSLVANNDLIRSCSVVKSGSMTSSPNSEAWLLLSSERNWQPTKMGHSLADADLRPSTLNWRSFVYLFLVLS